MSLCFFRLAHRDVSQGELAHFAASMGAKRPINGLPTAVIHWNRQFGLAQFGFTLGPKLTNTKVFYLLIHVIHTYTRDMIFLVYEL